MNAASEDQDLQLQLHFKEINGGLRLVRTVCRRKGEHGKVEHSRLIDPNLTSPKAIKQGEVIEYLPRWKDPIIGCCVFLLRAFERKEVGFEWSSDDSPLAGPLSSAVRKQAKSAVKHKWLYMLVGQPKDSAIGGWFSHFGTDKRNRRRGVRLGSNWRKANLKVYVDEQEPVSEEEYANIADALERWNPLSKVEAEIQDTLHIELWDGKGRFIPLKSAVKTDDRVRIRVEVSRPSYLFIVWIDQEGKPWPMYPWTGMKKWQAPENVDRTSKILIPDVEHGADPRNIRIGGRAGLETVVALIQTSPLDMKKVRELRKHLRLPPTRLPSSIEHAPVFNSWEKGAKGAPHWTGFRYPVLLGVPEGIRKLHARIRSKVVAHFNKVMVLTFVNRGQNRTRQ